MIDSRQALKFGDSTSFLAILQQLIGFSDSTAEHLCSGAQGQGLLLALGNFVKGVTLHEKDSTTKKRTEDLETAGGRSDYRLNATTISYGYL